MKRFNLLILKFIVCLLICYITNKIADTYLSGGIAGTLCMGIQRIIDKETKED